MGKKKQKKTPFFLAVYFSILLIFLETVFHFYEFGGFTEYFIFVVLFSVMAGMVLGVFAGLFPPRAAVCIAFILTSILCVFFCVEMVYKSVFQNFLAFFTMMDLAGQALDFTNVIRENIFRNIEAITVLLLPIPVFLLLVCTRLISAKRCAKRGFCIIKLEVAAACWLLAAVFINTAGDEVYSPRDVYYNNVSTELTVEYFGVITTNRLDALYAIAGKPSGTIRDTLLPEDTAAGADEAAGSEDIKGSADGYADGGEESGAEDGKALLDTSPNIMDIDFDGILSSAQNDTVEELTEYFRSQTGTNKNEYTGMFEGYNVIFITAEGFSKFVIDEELTPTLYRLKNEGFVFNHYYTPVWYGSTSDGEYANLTGLIPGNGIVDMRIAGRNGNNMFFTLGRQLERLGYTLDAFHNNSYTYYERDKTHTNMGYNWYGTGNWFEAETNSNGTALWPQSDLQLALQSVDMYMDDEPFHTYYMTVSGHMQYGFSDNQMAYRNRDAVEDLPFSETARGYIACQLELEKMLGVIVEELEERGIADHTVIVLSADHIPYNDKDICDELAGHVLDSGVEWYENDLIIWSGSMENPVVVDKYCYDVDILPTISNLLGLEYDSRLLAGQDILSDAEQFVYFPNGSFITGKCIYNGETKEVTSLSGEEITQDYIDSMAAVAYNKAATSGMILDEDYYRYLEGHIKQTE